jgi:D-glycero-D-manno-heptose 1,7-bisphosphate phosphatase
MLLQAAREHGVSLEASFMIGDRVSDILAGAAAGCKTILLETGKHLEKLIVTDVAHEGPIVPDWSLPDLAGIQAIIP